VLSAGWATAADADGCADASARLELVAGSGSGVVDADATALLTEAFGGAVATGTPPHAIAIIEGTAAVATANMPNWEAVRLGFARFTSTMSLHRMSLAPIRFSDENKGLLSIWRYI
jgi:hypothetical protein